MKCEDVRDELVAYARGELDEARRTEVEEHLVRCEGCTKELEGTRKVMAVTQMADSASIQELANSLIHTAIRDGATDLHLEMANGAPRVRLRIDGVLHLGPTVPPEQYEPLLARFKLMSGQIVSERQLPQDGRFRLSFEGKEYDLRVATFPYFSGESATIRILDPSSVMVGLDRLGFIPRALEQIEALLARPQGMIITTGTIGSGKTTTLYSLLQRLNRPELKIVTVEDPVEYLLPGLNQAAVNEKAGITFVSALRAFLSQDLDVLMVHEVRDIATLEYILVAAASGHRVLFPMHTRDTTAAIARLIDVGLPPYSVADTLTGVIGQRLVHRLCPACKEPYQPTEATLETLGFTPETRPAAFWRGAGCDQCRQTGYRGRTGLFEVLTVNEKLSRQISETPSEAALRARALELGLLWSFAMDARAKVTDGTLSADEAARVLTAILTESWSSFRVPG